MFKRNTYRRKLIRPTKTCSRVEWLTVDEKVDRCIRGSRRVTRACPSSGCVLLFVYVRACVCVHYIYTYVDIHIRITCATRFATSCVRVRARARFCVHESAPRLVHALKCVCARTTNSGVPSKAAATIACPFVLPFVSK